MEGAGSRGLRGTYLYIKNDAKKKLCRPTGPEKSHKSWRDFFFFSVRGLKKNVWGKKKKILLVMEQFQTDVEKSFEKKSQSSRVTDQSL